MEITKLTRKVIVRIKKKHEPTSLITRPKQKKKGEQLLNSTARVTAELSKKKERKKNEKYENE